MSFAHLHVHSEYSVLDGACRIDALAERAAALGQPALGLTDHGGMKGAVEHYQASKRHGVKPIVGLEGYKRGRANVDLALLERYSDGVIALTGCLQSRFCRRLVDDAVAEARSHVDQLLQVFGPEDVYFEVQKN